MEKLSKYEIKKLRRTAQKFLNDKSKSDEEKVDILVFPEMHGNAEMKKILRSRMIRAKFDCPKLVVLPSYWNDGKNIASVIERHGFDIIEQGKRIAFIDKDSYHENLKDYDMDSFSMHRE